MLPLLEQFKNKVGKDEILIIRGKYSPLFTTTWILKNGDFPLYMGNSKNESVFGFDLEVYKRYARDTFRNYLNGKFDIPKYQSEYKKYIDTLDEYYYKYIQTDLTKLEEKELVEVTKTVQNLFDDIVSTSLFIEFLTPEVIKEVLEELSYESANPDEILENLSKFPFDSFEKRHEYLKIKAIKDREGMIDTKLINELKYLYTDYQKTKAPEHIEEDLKKLVDKKIISFETNLAEESYTKSLSKNDKTLFDYFKFVTRLRDYRKDDMAKVQALFQVLAEELCDRAEISKDNAFNLVSVEMIKGVGYLKENKEDIDARKEGSEAYSFSYKNISIHACEVDINKVETELNNVDTQVKEIKGNSASKGFVKGKVRIVFDATKDVEFEEGDILVTSMTRPEFVPLMKKAGGIITNEGGITCHAAIVSRELKKPCVIGTKIATQVLKNGMEIELDANIGIIKII